MSQPLRRYPEDSVVVSIGQVRDMLRSDTKPPAKQDPEPAVPMAIPIAPAGQVVDIVLSAAEVKAEREARWKAEALPAVAGPARRPFWRRHSREIGVAAAGLVAGLLLAWLFSGPEVPPEVASELAEQTRAIAALQADLDSARTETTTARAETAAVVGQKDALARQLMALEAEKAEREKQASEKKKRARRRSADRAPRTGSRSRSKRRRRQPRLTRTDRKFDALMDGL